MPSNTALHINASSAVQHVSIEAETNKINLKEESALESAETVRSENELNFQLHQIGDIKKEHNVSESKILMRQFV